jgi:hypothetical protein
MLPDEEDVTRFGEHRDELADLLPLLGVERFDRRTVNRALAALVATRDAGGEGHRAGRRGARR